MAAADPEVTFRVKPNLRKRIEVSIMGKHMSVEDLKIKIQEDSTLWPKISRRVHWTRSKKLESNVHKDKPKVLEYLCNDVPAYPTPVQFHVSTVTHVTTEQPFREIMESQEFRPPGSDYSWWSLKINDEEIKSAEKLYLQENFPNLTREQVESHAPFLKKFTNSPAFQPKSRYGNYRFTFPLTELMNLYQEQNCGGKQPVLRVFKTGLYKQQILYAVLIHSPQDNKRFKKLPLLEESSFARYENGKVIWRAQAVSDDLQHGISTSDTGVRVEERNGRQSGFYVWDHVGLAFHLPMDTQPIKALKIPREKLVKAIEACELHEMNLITSRTSTENERVKENAERDKLYETAVKVVNESWRMCEKQSGGSVEKKSNSLKKKNIR